MSFSLLTTTEVAKNLSFRLKQLRLLKKWKRTTLAKRSGVTVSSLIRFEQESKISLDNLLKLLLALGRLNEIEKLLEPPKAMSIDDLDKKNSDLSKRGLI
ncbi:MAG: helix-turn-helix domain-containing protein [Spirochaetaceae bacterium]